MKFNLRDLFWLTLVAGLATGWLITLLAAPPKASSLAGQVYAHGKPFNGRIFLRSEDGRVISAPVHEGKFDLKYCTTGTYEIIYEGDEADLQHLNDGGTMHIFSYGDQYVIYGSDQPTDNPYYEPIPPANRRDNWRVSREEEKK